MMKRYVLWSILCLLLALGVGCGIGYTLFLQRDYDTSSAWRSLGSPPHPIARILEADFYTVYVQTTNGQQFSCYRASRFDENCWILVQEIPTVHPGQCSGNQPILAPPPPAPVRQWFDVHWCWRFGRSEYIYILLEDGTIMQWIYDDYYTSAAPTMERDLYRFVILGMLGGFLSGIILVGMILSKNRTLR